MTGLARRCRVRAHLKQPSTPGRIPEAPLSSTMNRCEEEAPGALPRPGAPTWGHCRLSSRRQHLTRPPRPGTRLPGGRRVAVTLKPPTLPGRARWRQSSSPGGSLRPAPSRVSARHPGGLLSSPRGDSVPSCIQVPTSTSKRARQGRHGVGASPRQGSAPGVPAPLPTACSSSPGSALGRGCELGRTLSEGPRAVSVLRPQRPGPLWAVS